MKKNTLILATMLVFISTTAIFAGDGQVSSLCFGDGQVSSIVAIADCALHALGIPH